VWILLAGSIATHIVVTELGEDPFMMVDLRVYFEGAGHLNDGSLYSFVSGKFDLPFTYPPFSALIFKPLYWIGWDFTRIIWEIGMLAALPLIIYLTLRLLGRVGPRVARPVEYLDCVLVAGSAMAIWLEPVRTTLNYGQINLFLVVLVLGAAVASRDWLAGAGIGLAAGIKLIPAISGLYLLLQRRFAAAAISAGSFAATIAVMLVVIPSETRRYFTTLIFDPSRTGPVFSAINQSWRGALARLAGHDVSTSWLLACAVTVAIGGWAAWAASRASDPTGSLLAVQFIGLLISPISWSHHWVWVVPLVVWGLFGQQPHRRAIRILLWSWLVVSCSYVVSILISFQGKVSVDSRPGWQSWLGTSYAVLGMSTLLVIGYTSRSSRQLAVKVPEAVAAS